MKGRHGDFTYINPLMKIQLDSMCPSDFIRVWSLQTQHERMLIGRPSSHKLVPLTRIIGSRIIELFCFLEFPQDPVVIRRQGVYFTSSPSSINIQARYSIKHIFVFLEIYRRAISVVCKKIVLLESIYCNYTIINKQTRPQTLPAGLCAITSKLLLQPTRFPRNRRQLGKDYTMKCFSSSYVWEPSRTNKLYALLNTGC